MTFSAQLVVYCRNSLFSTSSMGFYLKNHPCSRIPRSRILIPDQNIRNTSFHIKQYYFFPNNLVFTQDLPLLTSDSDSPSKTACMDFWKGQQIEDLDQMILISSALHGSIGIVRYTYFCILINSRF